MRLPHVQLCESTGVRLWLETPNSRSATSSSLPVLFKYSLALIMKTDTGKRGLLAIWKTWELCTYSAYRAAYVENCSLNITNIIMGTSRNERAKSQLMRKIHSYSKTCPHARRHDTTKKKPWQFYIHVWVFTQSQLMADRASNKKHARCGSVSPCLRGQDVGSLYKSLSMSPPL